LKKGILVAPVRMRSTPSWRGEPTGQRGVLGYRGISKKQKRRRGKRRDDSH